VTARTITHVYFGPVNGARRYNRLKIAALLGIDPSALRLSECTPEVACIKAALETKLVGLCAADIAALMLGGDR